MTAAYFEDHPTDPEKVILRKPPLDQGADYERGFIDGMQKQAQSSVDKAVNAMSQRTDPDWDALAEKHLASIKRDMKATFEDAAVRATHKVMAEFETQPEQEPPKYSFKAYWEADGHIGIAGVVVRPDGGAHVLQQTIDPPQRTWVGLTDDEMFELWVSADEQKDRMAFGKAVESKLKEKNT